MRASLSMKTLIDTWLIWFNKFLDASCSSTQTSCFVASSLSSGSKISKVVLSVWFVDNVVSFEAIISLLIMSESCAFVICILESSLFLSFQFFSVIFVFPLLESWTIVLEIYFWESHFSDWVWNFTSKNRVNCTSIIVLLGISRFRFRFSFLGIRFGSSSSFATSFLIIFLCVCSCWSRKIIINKAANLSKMLMLLCMHHTNEGSRNYGESHYNY